MYNKAMLCNTAKHTDLLGHTLMYKSKNLLSISADAKTTKGVKLGYLTGILYLAPATTTKYNTCPMAKVAQCDKACLYSAGRGAFNNVQQGRINKTIWLFEERVSFMLRLEKNISSLVKRALKNGLIPLVRLNGTSDIQWENVTFIDGKGVQHANIFAAFPTVQFYDYTKMAKRKSLSNYDLTFSYSGVTDYQPYVKQAIKNGTRMAVVFRSVASIPNTFKGIKVVSGDNSDVRHDDEQGVIVALYAKGAAKHDTTGFVVG